MIDDNKYMVCVACFTYNHAPFIENALNSFSMQKTSFPYICCIIDDASNDGEIEIIRKYVKCNFNIDDSVSKYENTEDYQILFAQHKNNNNCFFVVYFLNYNHYQRKKTKSEYLNRWIRKSSYYTCCEGDDYWTTPIKLQKQVDFMENHPDYSMCHADALFYVYEKNWNKGRIGLIHSKAKSFDSPDRKQMFYKILTGDIPGIVTCTACVRADYYINRIPNNKQFMMGDKPLWLDMSQMGRVKYFDEVFGVYVKHQGSATRTADTRRKFTFNAHEMKIYYCQKNIY